MGYGSDHETAHSDAAVEHADQPHERPEDWGWRAESGKVARGGGWVSVAVLLLMNLGNQTRHTENFRVTGVTAFPGRPAAGRSPPPEELLAQPVGLRRFGG